MTPSTGGVHSGRSLGLQDTEHPGHFGVPPTLHAFGVATAGGFCGAGGARYAGIGGGDPRDEMNPEVANMEFEMIPTLDFLPQVPGLL